MNKKILSFVGKIGMFRFFIDLITYFRFINRSKNRIAFFIDNKNLVDYLEPYIQKKINFDPIVISFEKLNKEFDNLDFFLFETNFFRSLIFLTHNLKTLYSSTPGLNKTIFKKSRIAKCKYIYLQHSPVSLTMAYENKYFDEFDAVQVINMFQLNEMKEMVSIRKLKCKIFKGSYQFLEKKIFVNKNQTPRYDILIAPTWNTNFFSLDCHSLLAANLKKKNIKFILRPHHMSFKKNEISKENLRSLNIEFDDNNEINFFDFKLLISDWSGIIFENAILKRKKSLLINTPEKVNNSEFKVYQSKPLEKVSREIFGEIFETSQLDELCDRATYLIDNPNEKEDQNIVNFINSYFF